MKILFHCADYPPMVSGVAGYIRNMAKALVDAGHAALVVTRRAPGFAEESNDEGITVFRKYDRSEAGTARVADLVLGIARENKIDVIEGADHIGECAPVMKMRQSIPIHIKVHACQVVKVLRDSQINYPWQRITLALAFLRVHRQISNERYSIEHADLISVPTRRLVEELRKQGLRLSRSLAVIPNPIVDPAPSPVEMAGMPTVLFAGRIEFGKGIRFLPGIIRDVVRSVPGATLEMAGADSYARGVGSIRAWLERRLGDVGANVRFLGELDPAGMDHALRRAWVVIVPSLWDNFPNIVLEAMIRGKSIVTTPHGGMPEMLENTGCPIVPPDSSEFGREVVRFLEDRQLMNRVGTACRERALREYSPGAILPRYLQFLESHK
ncbi:MAG: hypothetical protein C0404_09080 [Verrucomicrobia bacterium]|nr:hypothetical protein [Verrucomicrobiota bacterium]